MPRDKKDSQKNRKRTPRKKKASIHPDLGYMEQATVSLDDGSTGLGESELANTSGQQFMVYRVGPKSLCQGKRMYLHTFTYPPPLDELKELFGGGEFWVQIYENGAYSKGSPRIAIEGDPKTLGDTSPGKTLETLPSSADPIVNALLQTLTQFMENMALEIKELKGGASKSFGLTPDRVRELVSAATESQLSSRLIMMATGGGQPEPVDAEALADKRFQTMLEVFKMGIDTGRGDDGGGGTTGLLEKFAPLVERLLTRPPTGVPPTASARGVAADPAGAPIIDVSDGDGARNLEDDRRGLEVQSQEFKTEMLIKNLQKGVSVMLDAFESDTEYTDDNVCDFVVQAVSVEELRLVETYLTFDKVRLLMQSNPQEQISLDENKDRVIVVLAALVTRLPG